MVVFRRFVRFVSTPEVLERVTTIESEILQIEDAMAVQGNDSLGLRSVSRHICLRTFDYHTNIRNMRCSYLCFVRWKTIIGNWWTAWKVKC